MSLKSFVKLFTKPATPVATLCAGMACSQLANIVYYNLGSVVLASTFVILFQLSLVLTLFGAGGYLIFGSSDE